MINFSFIIPHKDLPSSYLRRMLDSIPHRDDVQILVVDDNSKSNNVDFGSFPGEGEKCTEIIYLKEDRGPGHARNVALENVKGEWVLFADADDYFDTDALIKVMDYCLTCSEDLLCVGVKMINLDGTITYDCYGCDPVADVSSVKLSNLNVLYENGHQSYKRIARYSLVKKAKARFAEINYCEDIRFAVQLMDNARNMSVCPIPVYCYVKRNNSITVALQKKNLFDAMNEVISVNRYYDKTGKECYLSVSQHILSKIYQLGYLHFLYFFFKECVRVSWAKGYADYKWACISNGVNSNPIKAVVDRMRVIIGGLK